MKHFVILGVVLLVSWVGAFAIALGVVEWRGGDVSARSVFDCWEKAWVDLVENDEDAPDPPSSGTIEARNRYETEFAAVKAHNELNSEHYHEAVRDCFP